MKNKRGITLISLVITIVVLVILSAVAIYLALGNNGILNKAEQTKNETVKQTATEKMNLKITNMQIEKYAEEQRMPTLQEFADGLCEDNEIQYVQLQSKKIGSLSKIEVGEAESIFTKLKAYPYEFEINSSLQLASIDGIKVASNGETVSKEEFETFKGTINNWTLYKKVTGEEEIKIDVSKYKNIKFVIDFYMSNYDICRTQETTLPTSYLLENNKTKHILIGVPSSSWFYGYIEFNNNSLHLGGATNDNTTQTANTNLYVYVQ